MKIKKNMFWAIMIILVIAAGFFILLGTKAANSNINGAVVSTNEVQIVKMYVKGSQYVFEPNSVKSGSPVKIEADISRMQGCSKSVVSSELGVRKTFTSSDNTLEFTPTKAGTFYFACSMNMYRGILTVK